MKILVSRKQIKDNFRKVYVMNETRGQTIFYGQSPEYYAIGIYGYNCDVYIINNDTAVAVGYRPFGDYLPESIENEIYKKALRVIEENKYGYNEKVKKITAIRANGFSRI